MPKNLVLCCDGTDNDVATDSTNTIADGVAGRRPIPAVLDDLLLVADDAVLVQEASIIAGCGDALFVHVDIGLLRGRTDGQKARLSEAVLALLGQHVPADFAIEPVLSVEVRDLAPSYRLERGRVGAKPGSPGR